MIESVSKQNKVVNRVNRINHENIYIVTHTRRIQAAKSIERNPGPDPVLMTCKIIKE